MRENLNIAPHITGSWRQEINLSDADETAGVLSPSFNWRLGTTLGDAMEWSTVSDEGYSMRIQQTVSESWRQEINSSYADERSTVSAGVVSPSFSLRLGTSLAYAVEWFTVSNGEDSLGIQRIVSESPFRGVHAANNPTLDGRKITCVSDYSLA